MTDDPCVLVVDDNRAIRDELIRYLERNGLRAAGADSASTMDRALLARSYDLVILDVMMPGEDGLSVCRRLRRDGGIPIIMLTALSDDADRIVGIEVGADDYICKPFNPREVLARIRAVLRRSGPGDAGPRAGGPARVRFGAWSLDGDRQSLVHDDGRSVELTTGEFRLLMAFVERPRVVLSRDRLLDLTVGRVAGPFDRAIDNQVLRLRRKLEDDPASPQLLATVRGGGYCLRADVRREF
jgi:two-component system, OmpR family, response regulator